MSNGGNNNNYATDSAYQRFLSKQPCDLNEEPSGISHNQTGLIEASQHMGEDINENLR
jgi:hypothetical protein